MLSAVTDLLYFPYQIARIQGTSVRAIEALSFDAAIVPSSLPHLWLGQMMLTSFPTTSNDTGVSSKSFSPSGCHLEAGSRGLVCVK
jgi:hypothetical protein|tara:strand:- start:311 stop:568 length:258 start_codon:yes stop_codon:yes gene_type:complete